MFDVNFVTAIKNDVARAKLETQKIKIIFTIGEII